MVVLLSLTQMMEYELSLIAVMQGRHFLRRQDVRDSLQKFHRAEPFGSRVQSATRTDLITSSLRRRHVSRAALWSWKAYCLGVFSGGRCREGTVRDSSVPSLFAHGQGVCPDPLCTPASANGQQEVALSPFAACSVGLLIVVSFHCDWPSVSPRGLEHERDATKEPPLP